jgi:hypothetical protein
VTGIVFRRLRTPSQEEAARRLLADDSRLAAAVQRRGGEVLFGLWDLAASSSVPACGVGGWAAG